MSSMRGLVGFRRGEGSPEGGLNVKRASGRDERSVTVPSRPRRANGGGSPVAGVPAPTPLGPGVDRGANLGLGRRAPEVRQAPRRAGRRPRCRVRPWRVRHRDIERPGVRDAHAADLGDELGQRVGTWQVDREEAVPPRRAAHRGTVRPARRQPDRDARPLHRRRLELAVPVSGQPLERGVEHPRLLGRVGDIAERRELAVPVAAQAKAEHEPAVAQVVERDRLARELVHPPARRRRDHRPDPHALGRARDRAQRHPRIGDAARRRRVDDVVPHEEAVPAALLGARGEPGDAPRIGEVVERGEVDPTGRHQRTGPTASAASTGPGRGRGDPPAAWITTATTTIAPPSSVAVVGFSSIASQTHSGPSTTSSSVISATCAAGISRAPTVRNASPSPICPAPSAARASTSSPGMPATDANGANATTRNSCDRHVAGSIDTSRRCRLITIETANASAISSDSPSPSRLPPPGPPTMSATPATATAIATPVRALTGSRSAIHASSAASTGAIAWMNSTCATVVWWSATMNDPDAVATHAANAIPARPTERLASTTRPCSLIATHSSSATPANAARTATWVAALTDSPRCRTPALDHARAASATYTCPRRWLRAASSAVAVAVAIGASQSAAGSSARARSASASASARPAARSRAAMSTPRRKARAAASAVLPSRSRYALITGAGSGTPSAANRAGCRASLST